MKIEKSYINLTNGFVQEVNVNIKHVIENEIFAVYINGETESSINPEVGACVEISVNDVQNWMADFRHSEFWCMPAFGEKLRDVPDETQGLIYQKNDGNFGVVLPIVSENYKCVLKGKDNNSMCAKLFSWCEGMRECNALAFVWGEGKNPFEILKKCTQTGLELLGTGYKTRENREYPKIFEYLGWCSWDAFEIRVDEKSLIAKCQEFKNKNIPVKWAIIDDMWAEVHDFYNKEYDGRPEMFHLMHTSRLYSFKADPKRFPNGLKKCIEKINDFGITVGMWHPTTGYWMGVDPEGEIYKEYKDCLIKTEDGRYIHSPEKNKAYRFYKAFHDYLQKSGAEFVKIDNQSMTRRFFKNYGPVGQIARQFHEAIEQSAEEHFESNMINCMGMANEDMWNRRKSAVSRCSDDFLPENREWFTKHILQCAYNCLIQGQFYYCDWDMWWTDDGQAEKNSILRAISGGPIYISDTLDRSKAEILKPLVLNDGRILRCERPGMPTKDCITQDPIHNKKIFKIQNICNKSGILAIFNIDEANRAVSGDISPNDIEGIEGEEFALYEHFSQKMIILKLNEKMTVTLKNNDEYKLYIIVPLHDGKGVIGRTDKFISPATIELKENGPYAYVENKKLVIAQKPCFG